MSNVHTARLLMLFQLLLRNKIGHETLVMIIIYCLIQECWPAESPDVLESPPSTLKPCPIQGKFILKVKEVVHTNSCTGQVVLVGREENAIALLCLLHEQQRIQWSDLSLFPLSSCPTGAAITHKFLNPGKKLSQDQKLLQGEGRKIPQFLQLLITESNPLNQILHTNSEGKNFQTHNLLNKNYLM